VVLNALLPPESLSPAEKADLLAFVNRL